MSNVTDILAELENAKYNIIRNVAKQLNMNFDHMIKFEILYDAIITFIKANCEANELVVPLKQNPSQFH